MSEYTLSNEEKSSILESHLRTLGYSKYNLEVNLMEEESATTPAADAIAAVNAQIDSVNKKIAALVEELASLSE
jgi:ubiquinone biosynthesis protein UbiJ